MELNKNTLKLGEKNDLIDKTICENYNEVENRIFDMIDRLPMEYAEAMYKSLEERAKAHLEYRKKTE